MQVCKSTSAILKAHGSVQPTRIPTGCYVSTSRRAQISADTVLMRSPPRRQPSIQGRARHSNGKRPQRHLTNFSDRPTSPLRRPLDSAKQTSICVVSGTGSVVREGAVDSDPEAIAAFVRSKAPGAVRIGLETGPTATWLWTELTRLDLPVICIDARHAKAVLKMQINKSDRNDAAGIARIMQTGWFKEVRVKDLDSHTVKALLASRALLVKIKRDLENQIRGLLKNFGLVIGRAKFNVFAVRAEELIEDRPELIAVVGPLLKARKAIEQQTGDLDRKVLTLARYDAQVRRFMTVPGVGPITALCFKATIDDPTRFKRSRSVGAYVGLTTGRHASGP